MSNFYPKLPVNTRVYSHTTFIPVNANKNEYRLEEQSSINGRRLVGIWVQQPISGGRDANGNTVIPQANLESAYLTLVESQTNIYKQIPLQLIAKANNNGHPFYVETAQISLSESTIKLGLLTGMASTDQIVLQFDYLKEAE